MNHRLSLLKKLIPSLICFIVIVMSFGIQSLLSIRAESNPENDLKLLLETSSPWMEHPTVIVKYGNLYKGVEYEDLAVLGESLNQHFSMPAGIISKDIEEQAFYQTEQISKQNGLLTSLRLVHMEEHQSIYLLITLNTLQDFSEEALFEHKEWIEKQLEFLNLSAKGNVMLQGDLRKNDAFNLNKFSDTLRLEEVERYEDLGTLSVSYYSPILSNTILAGTEKMNLQVAVHQDSVSNHSRITLGTPIITIEY